MRKENIEHAAREHARQNFPTIESASMYRTGKTAGYISGFIDGAQWVINSVWHDANEIPNKAERMILLERDGSILLVKYACLPDWKGFTNGNNIVAWAYWDDLLPERKEEAK